jgi:peptide-methionine (S)-S-oxide reductase
MTMKKYAFIASLFLPLLLVGCGAAASSVNSPSVSSGTNATAPSAAPAQTAIAIFAGGCFWCMEKPFDQVPGVISTTSGYTGGTLANPTYEQVGGGGTGHVEAVKIIYDPARVTYAQLVETYWKQVDPFDPDGQFCDQGETYAPVIFVANPEQQIVAETSKRAIETRFRGQMIGVRIIPATVFWDAEGYHQDYYLKNPIRYNYYRTWCGRDARLSAVWGPQAAPH